MGAEIERTFAPGKLPAQVEPGSAEPVEQGYLALDGETEVRVRRKADTTLLTIKHGAGQVRVEEELEISRETFDALWRLTERRRIVKRRHRIPLGDLTVEVDEFAGHLDGLVLADVEFASPEQAASFEPPDWLGREVTDDPRYANRRMAIEGRPNGEDYDMSVFPAAPLSEKPRHAIDRVVSPKYGFRSGETAAEGARRVALGRVDSAIGHLRNDEDPVEAVHDARKDLKKLRSLLRLMRGDLGRKAYRRENRRYRDAARLLSGSRDAAARLETVAALREAYGDEIPPAQALVRRLEAEAERHTGAGDAAEKASAAIAGGSEALQALKLDEDAGFDLFRPGLESSTGAGATA